MSVVCDEQSCVKGDPRLFSFPILPDGEKSKFRLGEACERGRKAFENMDFICTVQIVPTHYVFVHI